MDPAGKANQAAQPPRETQELPSAGGELAAPATVDVAREIDRLVDECRSTHLWYQRPDYYPRTDQERWRVLDAIQRHADRETFQRAGRLKECLSRPSSGASVCS